MFNATALCDLEMVFRYYAQLCRDLATGLPDHGTEKGHLLTLKNAPAMIAWLTSKLNTKARDETMRGIKVTTPDGKGGTITRTFYDTVIHPSGGDPVEVTAEKQADEYIRLRSKSGFPGLVGKTVE